MKHLDLFSGIGGFALAAQKVWGNEYENIGFCDNNRFCREVLKKRFRGARIFGDIRELTCEQFVADSDGGQCKQQKEEIQTGRNAVNGESFRIDLITGGFPCQPFSCAGRRKGTEDDRYLWPEMFRIIREFRPRWLIAENVRGILTIGEGMVFEQVCLDLEKEGYEIGAFVIPAVAVNAPHRRDRVWIVGNAKSGGQKGCYDRQGKIQHGGAGSGSNKQNSNASDTERSRRTHGISGQEQETRARECRNNNTQPGWQKNWIKTAAEFCGVDDGLPVELDGFKLSKAGHRVERIKALGNAIVPQVAVEIMKAIKAQTTAE